MSIERFGFVCMTVVTVTLIGAWIVSEVVGMRVAENIVGCLERSVEAIMDKK